MDTGYFNLSNDIEVIYGEKRAAIYDMNSGDVYSIDEIGASILRDIEQLIPVDKLYVLKMVERDSVEEFLSNLQQAGIGIFKSAPQPRQREDYSRTPQREIDVLWLELTERCNLKCLHCYADCGKNRGARSQKPSVDLMRKLIKEASDLSCKRLTFIGGEPLLEPDALLSLLRLAMDLKGITSTEVFSNGTIFREDLLEHLVATGTGFALSIYSLNPLVHDKVTQSAGSFEKTKRTLDFLASRHVNLRIAVIALRENEEEVESTVKSLRQMYPSAEVSYDVVRPIGRGCSDGISPKRQFREDVRLKPDFPKVIKKAFWRRHHGHSCLWGKLMVTYDGHVRPCVMARDISIGNIHKQSLSEIIESVDAKSVWGINKDNIPVCSICEFRYACVDCLPRTKKITGNFLTKPPECLYNPSQGTWNVPKEGERNEEKDQN